MRPPMMTLVDDDPKDGNVDTATTENPPPQAAPRRLFRSRSERMIAGVAGGLGEHLRIDPIIVRVAFVLLTFAGGLGVLVYLAAWLFVPEEGADGSLGDQALGGRRRGSWPAVLLVAAGALLMLSIGDDSPVVVWGLALIVAGVLVYRSEASPPPQAAPRAPTTPLGSPLESAERPTEPAARAQRPRSPLARLTVATALLVVGGAAMLDNAGALSLDAGDYPALALVVVGVGLLVGALWGRARALIVLGIALLPFALAGTLADAPVRGGVGDRTFTPRAVEDLRAEYRLGAGELVVDLTDLRWPDEPVDVDAAVAFGVVQVVVPEGVSVNVDAHAGAGEVTLFGASQDGLEVDVVDSVAEPSDVARLELDARASFGEVSVVRAETENALEEETG